MKYHLSNYRAIKDFYASNFKTKASGVALFVDQKVQVQVKELKNKV